MRFAKGQGTENDFVILFDPDGLIELSPRLVARLCDRRAGLGADGVLRVVRTAALDAPAVTRTAAMNAVTTAADSGWFMDYRNADGSIAEMCGNGIRVFTRYLIDNKLVRGDEFTVATRDGHHLVRVRPGGDITAEMGRAHVLGAGSTTLAGRAYEGVRVSVGNPHLVCLVDGSLDDLDLSAPPVLDRRHFPDGANVEFIKVTGRAAIQLRVHERGAGETRSCGTGAVAAAVATAYARANGVSAWRVRVPGGELMVEVGERNTWLTGPAVMVAEGQLCDAWLSAPGRNGVNGRGGQHDAAPPQPARSRRSG